MKKNKPAAKSEVTRRLRRRLLDNPAGASPPPQGAAGAGPESVAFWQQLKSIGGAAPLRYRRD